MITFKTLEHTSMEEIHQAFVLAFSDYQVKQNIPLEALRNMLVRRGYCGEISMGAFDGARLVGFVLNGLREWKGKLTAYDTGTGVIPDYRRQGIMRALMNEVTAMLTYKKIENYLLEVLQVNEGAIALYQSLGFQTVRGLDCYRLTLTEEYKAKHMSSQKRYEIRYLDGFDEAQWQEISGFWDMLPSWQNSTDSMKAVKDQFVYAVVMLDGKIAGYGIIQPKSGDVPQFGVHKNYRRQGIGTAILHALMKKSEPQRISILNVQSDCISMQEFIKHHEIPSGVNQFEMERSLTD